MDTWATLSTDERPRCSFNELYGCGSPLSLYCLPAATPGLAGLVGAARQAIQTSVDLLGAGEPNRAPDLINSLTAQGVAEMTNGSATMVDNYSTKLKNLTDIKSAMQSQDEGVDSSTYTTGDIATSTWVKIDATIKRLNNTLDSAPGPAPREQYLSPGVEIGLQNVILSAVVEVHDDIEFAAHQVEAQAGAINDSQPQYVPAPTAAGSAAPGRVPIDSSGGYDSKYTQPVRSVNGSTRREVLSRDQLVAYIGKALDALGITDPGARTNWTQGYLVLIDRESGRDVGAMQSQRLECGRWTPVPRTHSDHSQHFRQIPRRRDVGLDHRPHRQHRIQHELRHAHIRRLP